MTKPANKPTPLYFVSDHAGAELRRGLIAYMTESPLGSGWQIEDLGVDETSDYPDAAQRLAQQLEVATDEAKAVMVCGSGIGMSMAGNRYPWLRVALCYDTESARLARQHNNANALALGGRLITATHAREIVDVFFSEQFEGGRHQKRVDKMTRMSQ